MDINNIDCQILVPGNLYVINCSMAFFDPQLNKWRSLPEKETLLLIEQDAPASNYIQLTFLHGAHIIKYLQDVYDPSIYFEQLS